jgi:DNA-binding NtrC family response regulator
MKKILVIDDDTSFLETLSSYLKETGFIVMSAKSAIIGLEIIRTTTPDLVISDVRMPGLSGIELAYVLKGFKYNIPLILISAQNIDDKDLLKYLSFKFLEKPLDMELLNQYIYNAIN